VAGGVKMEEVVQKLTPFIPQKLRLDIFVSLWEEYKNVEKLASALGCKPAQVTKWLKEGKAPSEKYMPRILSLALRSHKVRGLLRRDVLEQVENLFADLNIFPERKGDLGKILDVMDEKSRQILWYLWWNHHAEIGELTELTEAETDMEVLSRLKSINLTAKQILGKEILSFQSSKVDPVTGEKVLFSWWLDEGLLPGKRAEPLVDIFEENDHIAIIAQLPAPVELTREAQVECKNGVLRVKIDKLPSKSEQ
jgi:hypothetical protein